MTNSAGNICNLSKRDIGDLGWLAGVARDAPGQSVPDRGCRHRVALNPVARIYDPVIYAA